MKANNSRYPVLVLGALVNAILSGDFETIYFKLISLKKKKNSRINICLKVQYVKLYKYHVLEAKIYLVYLQLSCSTPESLSFHDQHSTSLV